MKIGIITCHAVYNYGAALQALALQTYITQKGYDVEIINYQPEYLTRRYNFWYRNPNSRLYFIFKKSKFLYFPFALYHYYFKQLYKRVKPFKNFEKSFFRLSSKFVNNEDLTANYPGYEKLFAGSDQIWNSYLQNGKDPAFYLMFAPESVGKYSYAASFGGKTISPDIKQDIKNWLHRFQHISVREKSGLSILKDCGVEGIHVVDPVFLLSAVEWKETLSLKEEKEDYIFVYDLSEDNKDIAEYVVWLSKKTGFPIVSVNDRKKRSYADVNCNNAGPQEFLSLLSSAKYVVTTSFHASALSIVFEKEFFTFSNKGANNSNRMEELLVSLGIESRYNPSQRDFTPINYEIVGDKKNCLIKESTDFLCHCLSE